MAEQKVYPNCTVCCNQNPPVGCCSCQTITTLAREWSLSIAGLTNGTCGSASEYNGDFTLRWDNQCRWLDWRASPPSCTADFGTLPNSCLNHWTWGLLGAGTRYILVPNVQRFPFSDAILYEKLATSWNCTGPNVMALTTDPPPPAVFGNLPETVTLTPSIKRVPLCACSPPFDVLPTRWRVRVEGTGIGCGLENWQILNPAFDGCSWFTQVFSPYDITFLLMGDSRARSVAYLKFGHIGADTWFYKPMIDFDSLATNAFARVPPGVMICNDVNIEPPFCLQGITDAIAYLEPVF